MDLDAPAHEVMAMNALRSLAATGLVLSSCMLGCFAPESLSVEEEPGFQALTGGNTSGGDNGASDEQYWAAEGKVIAAAGRSLRDPGTWNVHSTTNADLVGTHLPPALFAYAVKCGLQKNSSVSWTGGASFAGNGHLATTAGWLTGALSNDATNDLLACLVAHLNPLGLTIPIALSGPSVANDGDDHSSFDVEEALWLVETDPSLGRLYTVWPRTEFAVGCSGGVSLPDIFTARVCGHDPENCALQFGDPSDCKLEPEGYYCKDKPALLTILRSDDLETLHPGCASDPTGG